MSLEEKKLARSSAKTKVTKAINKLKSSLQYCSDLSVLKSLSDNLEQAYDQLYDLNDDCVELGLSDDYLKDITLSFEACMRGYFSSLKAEEEISLKKKASPLYSLVERDLSRLQETMARVGQTLNIPIEDISKSHILEAQEDQVLLSSCKESLLNNLSNLTKLIVDDDLEGKVNNAMGKIDKLNRDFKVLIRTFQGDDLEISHSSANGTSKEASETDITLNAHAAPFKAKPALTEVKRTSPTVLGEDSKVGIHVKSSQSQIYPQDLLSTYVNHSPSYQTPPNMHSPMSPPLGAQSRPESIRTKLPSLPVFSGDRADWPEFRCVWISMAEGQYANKVQLAMELKRCCKGKAGERIRHIYVTHENAYEEIWERLREEYDDPGLCSQEAISRLMSLKRVEDQDYPGFVEAIDAIDGIYSQLKELHQLSAIHAVDVDRVSSNLPSTTRMEWLRRYRDLSSADKLAPFSEFVNFLRRERAAVARLAESMPKLSSAKFKPRDKVVTHVGHGVDSRSKVACAVHGEGHATKDCRNFLKMSVSQRYNELRKSKRCFNCFETHTRDKCKAPICACGKSHHKLLCTAKLGKEEEVDPQTVKKEFKDGYLASAGTIALFPICKANIKGSSKPVTVLLDGGSNASYVTSSCAQRSRLKRLDRVTLSVTTVGGKDKEYQSAIYEADLRTSEGMVIKVTMYELPEITGKISLLNKEVIEKLFPKFDSNVLMRDTDHVDMLIGTDHFGLHPKHEVASAGDNLSVMKGELGVCLVGTHPLLEESTIISNDVPRTLHECRTQSHHVSFRGKDISRDLLDFDKGQNCSVVPPLNLLEGGVALSNLVIESAVDSFSMSETDSVHDANDEIEIIRGPEHNLNNNVDEGEVDQIVEDDVTPVSSVSSQTKFPQCKYHIPHSVRALENLYSNSQTYVALIAVISIFAMIIGRVFYQVDSEIQNGVVAFLFIVINQVMRNMSVVELFIKERPIFILVYIYSFLALIIFLTPLSVSALYFLLDLQSGFFHSKLVPCYVLWVYIAVLVVRVNSLGGWYSLSSYI